MAYYKARRRQTRLRLAPATNLGRAFSARRTLEEVRAPSVSFAVLAVLATASCGGARPGPPPLNVHESSTRAQAAQGDPGFGYLRVAPAPGGPDQVGLATWYGQSFAGKKTSSGERFDPQGMTAAHRTLPFGTWVEVRHVESGNVVRVRINDRGPWHDSRKVIDLSYRAAEQLGIVRDGSARVELRVVRGPQ